MALTPHVLYPEGGLRAVTRMVVRSPARPIAVAMPSMNWTRQTQGCQISLHWTGHVWAHKDRVMRNSCLWLKMNESAWIHWQNLMCVFLELLVLVAAVRAPGAHVSEALLRLTFGSFAQRWP